MSEAYDRGKGFEEELARQLRRIGIKTYRNKRSGAGDTWKADLDMPGQQLHIEAKSQERIYLMDWWSQTTAHAGYKTPVLMIDQGGFNNLAVLRVRDFLNMVKTIQDDARDLTQLRGASK